MGHLSKRKYSFITKLNDSYYDPERKKWVKRKVKVGQADVKAVASIPYGHIEQFVKRLNMGRVVQVNTFDFFYCVSSLFQVMPLKNQETIYYNQ